MKARDYYEKYKDNAFDIQGVSQFIVEMSKESKEIVKQRNCKTDAAAVSVIKEMNDKCNAVMRLFEKDGKQPPLVRNAFSIYWKTIMPELARHI